MAMLETSELVMNMGPQHPSTHGVLRLVLDLDGEMVRDVEIHVGYLHRAMEKLAENLTYPQFVPYTDRMDYTAALSCNLALVMAQEKVGRVEVPPRAQYLRVILVELQRIAAHLLWLGTHALDLGAMSVFLYCFREREKILDLFEDITGARLTIHWIRIGGLPADATEGFVPATREFCKEFPGHVLSYERLLTENRIFRKRTEGVAVISAEDAINLGLTGPSLRGSGVYWDIRKAEPYLVYDEVDFEIPIGKNGDVYDRYLVRIEEMRQSLRIVEQCLDRLPSGPIINKVPRIWKVPTGEAYHRVEAPKGEFGVYIVSDGTDKPWRCRIRSPSFVNLQSLPTMIIGGLVADVVAAIGSIDVVMGECDR
ncbi:MAG: NADH-quinone oxidoreductase subunit D [Candidatus Tectomicrobia bacterium]|nr:NADH-quinone oxidoreductase subunit D [Candidatus Tectomicrobia bacterium]